MKKSLLISFGIIAGMYVIIAMPWWMYYAVGGVAAMFLAAWKLVMNGKEV